MPIKRVPPGEAARLQGEGWIYVDVRTVEEFAEGHPPGAYNVPFMQPGPHGQKPNPRFFAAMQAVFPPDSKLLLGCRTGNRSLRAAEALEERGFVNLIDVRGGFAGEVDALGDVVCPGWSAVGLPVATAAEPGHSWAELEDR
jgi:rhodanese-related sulfurtransferase